MVDVVGPVASLIAMGALIFGVDGRIWYRVLSRMRDVAEAHVRRFRM